MSLSNRLYKPSEYTIFTGLAIWKLLHEMRFWGSLCVFLRIQGLFRRPVQSK
jgi:hypothetical protein